MRAVVDGDSVVTARRKELYEIRMKFGVLFQGAALFDSMTVEENIGLGLITHTEENGRRNCGTGERCLNW
jgi:phospholipid/cholesterol/gamma-HCH transport system ATP-binding protein